MNILNFAHAFFGDSAHWHGYDGIPTRFAEHIKYSLEALLIATAIGLPVGLLTGHTANDKNEQLYKPPTAGDPRLVKRGGWRLNSRETIASTPGGAV